MERHTEGEIDIQRAREILDEDHYGLDRIKERILEYLAVRKLKQEAATEDEPLVHREPILCFVGAPASARRVWLSRSRERSVER